MNVEKCRKWFIEANQGAICFNQVQSILDAQNNAVWAFIYHDKDTNDDGTIKEPHYHIFISYKNARDFETMKGHFPGAHIEQAQNEKYCIQYLIHRNAPEKYQYNINEVKSNMFEDIKGILEEPFYEAFNPNNILAYLKEGTTSILLLYARFGGQIQSYLPLIRAVLSEYSSTDIIFNFLVNLSRYQVELLGQALISGSIDKNRIIEIIRDNTNIGG